MSYEQPSMKYFTNSMPHSYNMMYPLINLQKARKIIFFFISSALKRGRISLSLFDVEVLQWRSHRAPAYLFFFMMVLFYKFLHFWRHMPQASGCIPEPITTLRVRGKCCCEDRPIAIKLQLRNGMRCGKTIVYYLII